MVDEYELLVRPGLAGPARYVDLELVRRRKLGSAAVVMRSVPSR